MFSRLRCLQILIIFDRKKDRFGFQKLHFLRISFLKSYFDDFLSSLRIYRFYSILRLPNVEIMLILGSKKLDSWNSQEYRFFELEIHHYSFLLEFVEFLDEMKTPEIKKNMKFGHHSVHPSWIHTPTTQRQLGQIGFGSVTRRL